MNKFWLLLFLFALGSCTRNKSIIQEVDKKYYVEQQISSKDNSLDTLCIFYDFDNPSKALKTGFYKDGFMNSTWTYNQESGIKEIEWAHYHDKYLKFDTNVFPFIDSIKHGKYFSKLLFKKEHNAIILSISVNSPIKGSLETISYDEITKSDFLASNVKIVSYRSKNVKIGDAELHLINANVLPSEGKTKYIQGMCALINHKDFIEISVTSSLTDNFYAQELFQAAVANFSLKNKFLFRKEL